MGNNAGSAAGGGAIYGLGIFGAWVYFWQQAGRFLGVRLRDLQGSLLARLPGVRGTGRAGRVMGGTS